MSDTQPPRPKLRIVGSSEGGDQRDAAPVIPLRSRQLKVKNLHNNDGACVDTKPDGDDTPPPAA